MKRAACVHGSACGCQFGYECGYACMSVCARGRLRVGVRPEWIRVCGCVFWCVVILCWSVLVRGCVWVWVCVRLVRLLVCVCVFVLCWCWWVCGGGGGH